MEVAELRETVKVENRQKISWAASEVRRLRPSTMASYGAWLSRLVKHHLDVHASGSQRIDGTQIGVRQVVVRTNRNAGGISMTPQMMLRVQRQSNVGVATWNL